MAKIVFTKIFIGIVFILLNNNLFCQGLSDEQQYVQSDTLKCIIYYPTGEKKIEFSIVNKCINGAVKFYYQAGLGEVEGYIKNDCDWLILNDDVFELTDTTYNHIKTGHWAFTIGPYTMLRSYNGKP